MCVCVCVCVCACGAIYISLRCSELDCFIGGFHRLQLPSLDWLEEHLLRRAIHKAIEDERFLGLLASCLSAEYIQLYLRGCWSTRRQAV
jgi:hypothetical protein